MSFITIPTPAATSGTCGDNLTWKLDDKGTFTISGKGSMYDYSSSSNAPWYSSRASITNVVINDGVTSIGNYAFYWCSSLSSITIPDSVTTIGNYAFEDCSYLTNINIPDSVTSIGSYAFSGCEGLTSVNITNIEAWCNIDFNSKEANPLYYAKNLYLSGKLVTNLTIEKNVTSIGDSAFFHCKSLTSVTIRGSVTSIGCMAFCYCSNLTSIAIGGSVISIGDYAFYDCTKLATVSYSGNESAWNSIYISSNNVALTSAEKKYFG